MSYPSFHRREIWATDAEIAATAQCLKLGIMVMKDEEDKIVEQTFSLADVKEIMVDASFIESQGEKGNTQYCITEGE